MAGTTKSMSCWSTVLGILVAFAGASWLVTSTSNELTLLSFLLPIGLALYNFGPPSAYVGCLLASLVGFQPLWPTIGHFALLAFFTALASRHLHFLRHTRERQRRLSELLPLCPNCGELLCHDGQWRPFDQALLHLSSQRPHHTCTTD
jgi:hypothetical protein